MQDKQPVYEKKQLNFKQLKNNLINQNDIRYTNDVNNGEIEGVMGGYQKYTTPVRQKGDNYSICVSGGSYSNQFTNPRQKMNSTNK